MKRKQDDEILNEGLIDEALAAEEEEIKSRKFKYGTLATIFTVIFIIAIILVNVLLGYMTDRFVWEFDMTKEHLFEISEDTKEIIDDLSRDVTITVLADETVFRDADQMLYTLDPMRLAQPRGQYPCTAPARLRIGPDWLAYAGNWMTEWERTKNTKYRDKIIAGMKSIARLPSKLFTGPLALGYDPATGIITTECDSTLQTTNHLMTIMGGFEIMNEMMRMIQLPEWEEAWLDHAAHDKQKALEIKNSRFRISRLLERGK